jgi:hypothetical protein
VLLVGVVLCAAVSAGCGHSAPTARSGPPTMSSGDRAKVAKLDSTLRMAAEYPVAFAGQGAVAVHELLRICRTKRSWIATTNPRRTLAEVVDAEARSIKASRPDLAASLASC